MKDVAIGVHVSIPHPNITLPMYMMKKDLA